MLLTRMFARVAIATDNAGQGPIVTARDELRSSRATFFWTRNLDILLIILTLIISCSPFSANSPTKCPLNGSGQLLLEWPSTAFRARRPSRSTRQTNACLSCVSTESRCVRYVDRYPMAATSIQPTAHSIPHNAHAWASLAFSTQFIVVYNHVAVLKHNVRVVSEVVL